MHIWPQRCSIPFHPAELQELQGPCPSHRHFCFTRLPFLAPQEQLPGHHPLLPAFLSKRMGLACLLPYWKHIIISNLWHFCTCGHAQPGRLCGRELSPACSFQALDKAFLKSIQTHIKKMKTNKQTKFYGGSRIPREQKNCSS